MTLYFCLNISICLYLHLSMGIYLCIYLSMYTAFNIFSEALPLWCACITSYPPTLSAMMAAREETELNTTYNTIRSPAILDPWFLEVKRRYEKSKEKREVCVCWRGGGRHDGFFSTYIYIYIYTFAYTSPSSQITPYISFFLFLSFLYVSLPPNAILTVACVGCSRQCITRKLSANGERERARTSLMGIYRRSRQ